MEKKKCYTLTNNMDDYRNLEFTGYCWMSDEQFPRIVDGVFALPAIGKNPFVAEANLYSKNQQISISIEHNDGRYLVGIVDWNEANKDNSFELEEQTYLSHRLTELPGGQNLKEIIMVRAWVAVEEPLCENMEELRPAWRAFKGFKSKSI